MESVTDSKSESDSASEEPESDEDSVVASLSSSLPDSSSFVVGLFVLVGC